MAHTLRSALGTGVLIKIILVIACIDFIPNTAGAVDFTMEEVRAAVQTWVRQRTPDARPDAHIERMEPYIVDGETVAYIAHLRDGGFCLCGSNELLLPVYYYSLKGKYDKNEPFSHSVLEEIAAIRRGLQSKAIRKDEDFSRFKEISTVRSSYWQDLIAGGIPEMEKYSESAPDGPDVMVLNLTSLWDQHSPYNDQCPVLTPSSDEHAVVGCCPLSMAQTMYYWKWPTHGTGVDSAVDYYEWISKWIEEPLGSDPGINASYESNNIRWWENRLEWSSIGGGKLRMRGYWDGTLLSHAKQANHGIVHYDDPVYQSALDALYARLLPGSRTYTVDFAAATYDYSIMQDMQSDPPDPVADAEAAKLCYHAGVAQKAFWGVFTTARGSVGAGLEHLKDHFRYDNDAYTYSLDNSTLNILIEEIQWLRQLIMCGSGHCVNVFGYDISGVESLLRINNGWGYVGGNQGWYTLDEAWPSGRDMSVWLAPNNAKFIGSVSYGDGSPSDPYRDIEEATVEAPDDSTLIFKAGSINTFSAGNLVIDGPLILKGSNVRIRNF